MFKAPIKPTVISNYEEPIRENYVNDVSLNISSRSLSCTINELREIIRNELKNANVTLLKNIDDIRIYYNGSYDQFFIKIPNEDSYQIVYDKWKRIIKKESKRYSKYKNMMDEYYNELELYNARVEKINKMIETGEL